jgi:hypothetical protein
MCFQVEVSATSWSLVQRSPTECGVSKVWSWSHEQWDGLGPQGAVEPLEKKCIKIYCMPLWTGVFIINFGSEHDFWMNVPNVIWGRTMLVFVLVSIKFCYIKYLKSTILISYCNLRPWCFHRLLTLAFGCRRWRWRWRGRCCRGM